MRGTKQSRSSSPANIVDAVFCSSCSAQIAREATFCPSCGHPNKAAANYGYASGNGMVDGMPIKSRVAAGLLALFVGGLGVHKFYCGHIGLGVVYLIFFLNLIYYLTEQVHHFFHILLILKLDKEIKK